MPIIAGQSSRSQHATKQHLGMFVYGGDSRTPAAYPFVIRVPTPEGLATTATKLATIVNPGARTNGMMVQLIAINSIVAPAGNPTV
jgi:hypothetical protein